MPRVIAGAAAMALLLAPLTTASAQDWPSRAVTMVVPYAAGGPVDTLGRILAARLSDILGQQVVVENVAGAGGMTGSSRAAKAPPDGYTVLLSGSAVLAINQTLYKRPLYNAVTDFEHVALFSDSARVLITRKDLPVTTLAEFVAYARANQAKMQCGSAGAGSGMHVCAVRSTPPWAPRSRTCPIAARRRRCRIWWADASTSSPSRFRPRCRRFKAARSRRSPRSGSSARPVSNSSPPRRSWALPASTAAAGVRSRFRRERRTRSCGASPRPSTRRWKHRPCASGSRASA